MPAFALIALWTGFGLLPISQDSAFGQYLRLVYIPPILCFEAFLLTFPLQFDGYISISWYVVSRLFMEVYGTKAPLSATVGIVSFLFCAPFDSPLSVSMFCLNL